MAPRNWLTAVVADEQGQIIDLQGYAAVGADGPLRVPLAIAHSSLLPHGGELMYLPDRRPVVWDIERQRCVVLSENPHAPGERVFPVAAFNSPGYVIAYTSAYEEAPGAGFLPLFSYAAVGWSRGRFRSPVILVDDEPRQDLRQMPRDRILSGIKRLRKKLPDNRLRAHLEKCALTYGCPAGKNFFLGRYEAPLPTATTCNARCLGCISLQSEGRMPSSQNRIDFTPSPEEIAQVALAHIDRAPEAVVSFGQGCEGDPLMAADTIAAAVRRIRSATDQGTINVNTNGSLPEKVALLLDAGVNSLRISMNSVRPEYYSAYFRPRGYRFLDVLHSIDLAIERGTHVAVNYLNCPGFTDTAEERDALFDFLRHHPLHMIQWRNLNYDPVRYLAAMNRVAAHGPPIGVRTLLEQILRLFPKLAYGYFNPPKERYRQG